MAYTYTKLNEVALVELATEPNFLIEDGGEIKRISAANVVTPQTQADWEETDPTKASYILNKPESLGGSGGKVITYTYNSGLLANGVATSAQEVLDEWNAGSTLRFAISSTEESNVFNVSYTMVSGALSTLTIKYLDGTAKVQSQTI